MLNLLSIPPHRRMEGAVATDRIKPASADQIAARAHARDELVTTLSFHGIRGKPHFHDGPGEEKALYINVGFATARRERLVIFGLLQQQGWYVDPERLSRCTFAIETIRVRHKPSGARMTVILRIPTGEAIDPAAEAA